MRYTLTALICVLAYALLCAPADAQRRRLDDFRDFPDPIYDYPSPMVREMRERNIRQPYGQYGPYQPWGNGTNATGQNGANGTNATTPDDSPDLPLEEPPSQ